MTLKAQMNRNDSTGFGDVLRDTSDFEKARVNVFNLWSRPTPARRNCGRRMRVGPLRAGFVRIALFAVPTFVQALADFSGVLPM